jgi:hypothetical protein
MLPMRSAVAERGPILLSWDFGVRAAMGVHCPQHASVVRIHGGAFGQNARDRTHRLYCAS